MRAALMLLLLAGCSSNSAAPPDLAAGACTFVLGGATSDTRECMVRFCREASGDSLEVAGLTPFGPDLAFTVDGPFTAGRSYTAADVKTLSAQLEVGSLRYVYVAGSVATLTVADVEWNANDSCPTGGILHGSALVELVESTADDGGATSPGHVSVDATF